MTDLEKAIELARKHEELFGIRKREENCVAACQEMAEWKEKQLINKACEWLKDWLESEKIGIPITASSRKSFLKEFKESIEGGEK